LQTYQDYGLFVIVLDERTAQVQKRVRMIIGGNPRFVLGIAIREIEAWWLGDRSNTLEWVGFRMAPHGSRYAARAYCSEKDDSPKKTLDELTMLSDRFDRCYGQGSSEMAEDFSERFWQHSANLEQIASQCPRGFRPFRRSILRALKQAKKTIQP